MKTCLVFIFMLLVGSIMGQTEGQKFTPPPPAEGPADIKVLIDGSKMGIDTKQTTTAGLLKDVKLVIAHEYPRFRFLVRDNAVIGKTAIVTINEPGQPLVVSGTIYDKGGKPAKNALIYMYQTSSKGWYSDKAYHISGMEGDHRYARLFGYLRTDDKGHYEVSTIKPAGYPGSELPAHIHFFVTLGEGAAEQRAGAEIQFADDPRLTLAMLERSRGEGAVIVKTRLDAGILLAEANFTLK